MKKKIAISLVTMWKSYTINSLKTLFESDVKEHDCTLYIFVNDVVDDKKVDDVQKQIDEMKQKYGFKIIFLYSSYNEGITIPRIKIMDEILKTDAEYFLEIHDDMIFTNDFFTPLMNTFAMNKKYKIVMPSLIHVENLETESSKDIISRGNPGRMLTENPVQAHPWLVNMSLIKEIGYYDKAYAPSACEDDDFYKRSYDAGYIPVINSLSLVGHKTGFTRNATKLGYCNYKILFFEKHNMHVKEFQVNCLDKNRKIIKY